VTANGLPSPGDAHAIRAHWRRPRSWGYWLTVAAVLVVVLYLFFFLPLPDARVMVAPVVAG
jgi:hypothetical protein